MDRDIRKNPICHNIRTGLAGGNPFMGPAARCGSSHSGISPGPALMRICQLSFFIIVLGLFLMAPVKAQETMDEATRLQTAGVDHYVNARYPEAIEMLEKAASLNPEGFTLYRTLAFCYNGVGNTDKALLNFKKALEVDPDNPEVNSNLGHLYFKLDQFEQAVVYFQQALAQDYQLTDLNRFIGYSFVNMDDYQQAIPFLIEAVKSEPQDAPLNSMLGKAYLLIEQDQEAVPYLEMAISLDPSEPVPYVDLGMAQIGLEDFKQAEETLHEAKDLFASMGDTTGVKHVEELLEMLAERP